MTDNVPELVDLFGGQAALAAALNVRTSAVSNWKRAKRIPDHQKHKITRLARKKGIVLPEWFWAVQVA